MIVFDLKCSNSHKFEVWFRSSADYDDQRAHGEVECPVCGDLDVSKAVMAPNIGAKGNQASDTASAQGAHDAPAIDMAEQMSVGMSSLPSELQNELEQVLTKVQTYVETNCEYVGDEFAEEARKIHYGESEERGIYGEASEEESLELADEGIEILPLPLLRKPGPSDA